MSRRDIGTDDPRVHVRPGRGSRPRTKIRPDYSAARRGRVTAIDRGRYGVTMLDDSTELVAVKARELPRGSVAVGDVCAIVGDLSGAKDTLARIVAIDERRTALRRTAEDGDEAGHERVIVANADQMVIVSALTQPAPKTGFIDRCLVAAYDAGLEPIVVFTKADMTSQREIVADYSPLDLQIFVTALPDSVTETSPNAAVLDVGTAALSTDMTELPAGAAAPSAATRGVLPAEAPSDTGVATAKSDGIEAVKAALAGHVSVLIGQSGVGKSTLINALVPHAARATGAVNAVTGKGRHTSTSAVALTLPQETTPTTAHAHNISRGGALETTPNASTVVIDTPGVRGFGLAHVSADSLLRGFPDLLTLTDDCPRGCTHHAGSPECALAAVDSPSLQARVASYHRLLEALDKPDWA